MAKQWVILENCTAFKYETGLRCLKEAQSDSISVRLSFISQWWDSAPVRPRPTNFPLHPTGNDTLQSRSPQSKGPGRGTHLPGKSLSQPQRGRPPNETRAYPETPRFKSPTVTGRNPSKCSQSRFDWARTGQRRGKREEEENEETSEPVSYYTLRSWSPPSFLPLPSTVLALLTREQTDHFSSPKHQRRTKPHTVMVRHHRSHASIRLTAFNLKNCQNKKSSNFIFKF